jgi:hypothetical protein
MDGRGVAIADVNGDGAPDLLVTIWNDGLLSLPFGNGDGTFQPPLNYGTGGKGPEMVIPVDVNGDHKLDIVVANVADQIINYTTGIIGVLLRNGTPVTLASSWNPAPTGKVVTYRATLTVESGGAAAGTVTFLDGSSTIATVPVANNQAAHSTTYTKGGSHSITAIYWGDAHNAAGMSGMLVEYISSVASQTALTTSGSPTYVGQSTTFTATVTSRRGIIPDCEFVTFYDGIAMLASVALASGRAEYTTSSLTAKTHYIHAQYAGDATFKPSAGSVQQAVLKYPTHTTLTTTPNPSAYGQMVTFTATVSASGPYPLTGTVKFWDGATAIGSVKLNGGVAMLKKSTLAVGTHAITAQYLSDSYNAKSTSNEVDQVVQ